MVRMFWHRGQSGVRTSGLTAKRAELADMSTIEAANIDIANVRTALARPHEGLQVGSGYV